MRVLVVSVVVHAAAFALVMRTPRREHAPAPAATEPIEIMEDEPPRREEPSASASSSTEASASPMRASSAVHHATGGRASGVAPAEASTGDAPGEAPAPMWTGSFFDEGPKDIGLGRTTVLLPPSDAPAPPSSAPRKVDMGLRFGPSSEGPALTVLRDVTSRSLAPDNGRARFTVRVDADGKVLGIDLDDATGGPGWDDARRLALDEMKEKKIFVPRGARGLNVRFEIVSELGYPSGQKKAGQFGLRDEGNPIPAVVLPDESNIGQRPTRKVHARHLSTEVL